MVWWNAVSNTATCSRPGRAACTAWMPARPAGLCSGASGIKERIAAITSSSTSTESVNFSPPCTIRWAGAGQVTLGTDLRQDAGHDGGKAAVVEVLLLRVPVFPPDPQHRPGLAHLVGHTVQHPLAATGCQQRELHR